MNYVHNIYVDFPNCFTVYGVPVLSPPQGMDKCKFVVFLLWLRGFKHCELYGSVLHRSPLNQYPLDRPIGGVAGTRETQIVDLVGSQP